MCSQANADRQTDRWVFGTRVTDWEHMYNGWRNQRQYILYVCISVGFFLLSRLTSEFKSALTKMRHAQSRFQASFSSQYLLVLMTAKSGREWHIVALTVQRHFRYMRHRIKTKSTPATPPRNPSTCFLPSCKCTQALVTSTICVSWWIIQELAAVCSVGEHAKRNQSARSRETSTFKESSLHYVLSARSGRREGVCGGGEVEQRRRKKTKLYGTLMDGLEEGMLGDVFWEWKISFSPKAVSGCAGLNQTH